MPNTTDSMLGYCCLRWNLTKLIHMFLYSFKLTQTQNFFRMMKLIPIKSNLLAEARKTMIGTHLYYIKGSCWIQSSLNEAGNLLIGLLETFSLSFSKRRNRRVSGNFLFFFSCFPDLVHWLLDFLNVHLSGKFITSRYSLCVSEGSG